MGLLTHHKVYKECVCVLTMTNEETKTSEESQEREESGTSELPRSVGLVGRAEKASHELKIENERLERNIKQLEELKAEQILSGTSHAGQAPVKKVEESDLDFAKRLYKGGLTENPFRK